MNDLVKALLAKEERKQIVKSFTLIDFNDALSQVSASDGKKLKRKKILDLFKMMDTESNGTIDTEELIKLWIRGKETTDST